MATLLRLLPWVAAVVVVMLVGWTSGVGSVWNQQPWQLVLAWAVVVAILLGITSMLRPSHLHRRLHLYWGPVALLVSSSWFLLFVESQAVRWWFALAVGGVLLHHFSRLGLMKNDGGESPSVAESLAVIWIATVFFVAAGLFGLPGFADVPAAVLALVFGVTVAAVTVGAAAMFPMPRGDRRLAALAFGIVAMQLFAGLSFFPTSAIIGASTVAIFYAVGLFVLHRVTHAPHAPHRFHRELGFAVLMVIMVLSTGQWT